MSERPTPETDANLHRISTDLTCEIVEPQIVDAELSRKLERERDEAIELLRWAINAGQLRYSARHEMNGAYCDTIDEINAFLAKFKEPKK